MQSTGGSKSKEKENPCKGIDDMNDARLRKQVADASNPAFVSVVCPWMREFQYEQGATLEDFSIWMHDEILSRAMQVASYDRDTTDNCVTTSIRSWLPRKHADGGTI
eukprot:4293515-Pyramimonas_sp.AAC.1